MKAKKALHRKASFLPYFQYTAHFYATRYLKQCCIPSKIEGLEMQAYILHFDALQTEWESSSLKPVWKVLRWSCAYEVARTTRMADTEKSLFAWKSAYWMHKKSKSFITLTYTSVQQQQSVRSCGGASTQTSGHHSGFFPETKGFFKTLLKARTTPGMDRSKAMVHSQRIGALGKREAFVWNINNWTSTKSLYLIKQWTRLGKA